MTTPDQQALFNFFKRARNESRVRRDLLRPRRSWPWALGLTMLYMVIVTVVFLVAWLVR